MSRITDTVRGHYRFEEGTFIADEGMSAINTHIRQMRLLADIGPGVPSFYLDPSDGSYWQCTDFEDHSKELRKVDRDYIARKFPTVDPDRPIT